MHTRSASLVLALLLTACSGGDAGTTGASDGTTGDDGSTATSVDESATGSTSVGPGGSTGGTDGATSTTDATTTGSGETDSDTDTGGPAQACDELGLPAAALNVDAAGTDWGEAAGDFTVNTTFGVWNLASEWSGCDSYVFINHIADASGTSLKNSLKADLFERSALNVHYFFASYGADAEADAADIQTRVGGALAGLDAAGQEHWRHRVHFVTDPIKDIEGSVGAFLGAQGVDWRTFAIDRAQTWDNPGSFQDTLGGGFAPDMNVLGYVGRFYNFRYDQDQALAAQQDVTIVPMMEGEVFAPDCTPDDDCFDQQNGPFSNSNNNQVWAVDFPDADAMAQFDTMEFELSARCGPDSYADCGHWDYEAFIQLCKDQGCAERDEIIRWITPYSRPGTRRWVFDTTPFLGMVKAGGTHYFRFGMLWNMNPSTWDMRFRLRDAGVGYASREVIPVFSGNPGFNDTYNDNWSTQSFTPPPGTQRVELVAIISGHGQDAQNCAEWCNHQHDFTINGATTYRREFPGQVVQSRCGEAVDEGVIPGQWGNWTPGRAGWCPGQPVQPWRVDITGDVTAGQENTIDYEGLFNNGTPVGGRIRINSYVVFYQ